MPKRKSKKVLYHYATLPKVSRQIKTVMRQLGIKEIDSRMNINRSIKNEKRFYMPSVVNQTGQAYFFKARLQNTEEVYRSAINEINFHKRIKPIAHRVRSFFIIPEYVKSGQSSNGFTWFLREYQDGQFAGNMDIDLGYAKSFLNKIKPGHFAKAIIAFQRLTPKITKVLRVPKHGYKWYNIDFQFYLQIKSLRRVFKKELSFIEQFYQKESRFINNHSTVLSHGDLYPNNIMLNDKNKLVLFDWEMLNLNNLAFDPAFIYLLAWRDKNWQRLFLKNIYSQQKDKEKFKKLFRICTLSLSLRLLGHAKITRRQNYHRQMKKNGLSNQQIKIIRAKAPKTIIFHTKALKQAIYQPYKFFQFKK